MNRYYALIAAGGRGTRLWPLSRINMPKQLLPLIDDHSMFRTSIERIQPLFAPQDIFVATGEQYAADLMKGSARNPRGELHHRALRQEHSAGLGIGA